MLSKTHTHSFTQQFCSWAYTLKKSHLALQGRSPGGLGVHRGACRVDCGRGTVLVTHEEGRESQHLDVLVRAHSLSYVQLCAAPRPVAPRLFCPWDSPSKNIGVGCHALFQGIFLTQGSNPRLLCLLSWQARFFTTSATWECWIMW